MLPISRALVGASLLAIASPALAQTIPADEPLTDVIYVDGVRPTTATIERADPVEARATEADAAALVARLPGAALIGNGAISGQVQYRGLFSDRIGIRVGGQTFQTGGPNAMDPPLHYAPMILIDRIDVSRGAAPVSAGPGLGGMVDARLKTLDFDSSATLTPAADVAASWRSADDGLAVGGIAGLASERWRINAIAAWEEGDDYRIGGGGTARDTGYERLVYGLSTGFQSANNRLSLDLRRQETGPSGNPPFAMDILYFHTNFARAAFDGEVAGHRLHLALGYTDVQHGMDNNSLRPAPANPAQFRFSFAEAQTLTAEAQLGIGPVTIGVDHSQVDRLVTISNPRNAAFFITSLNGIDQRRTGLFAEWRGEVGALHGDAGVRIDWHDAAMAAPRTGTAVPAMIANLAQSVAATNAPRSDTTWDAVLRLWAEMGALRPRLTLAHKSRVPNTVERFSWLPTEASGGLADNNIYVGRQNLRPEEAWSVEAGVDVETGMASFRPTIFYRRVDDYIQGTAVPATMAPVIAIATMNGDATPLIFTNVDAELYGVDADAALAITPALRLEGTISYVRGKRRDIADNLYRIAPLRGRAAVTYASGTFAVTAEAVGAAAQNDVSVTNGDRSSPGWVIANLWGDMRLGDRLRLSAGVENLFDRRYADHLAGINRVGGSDVAVGERLPGVGRSLFVRLGVSL